MPDQRDASGFHPDHASAQVDCTPAHAQHLAAPQTAQAQSPPCRPVVRVSDRTEPQQLGWLPDLNLSGVAPLLPRRLHTDSGVGRNQSFGHRIPEHLTHRAHGEHDRPLRQATAALATL